MSERHGFARIVSRDSLTEWLAVAVVGAVALALGARMIGLPAVSLDTPFSLESDLSPWYASAKAFATDGFFANTLSAFGWPDGMDVTQFAGMTPLDRAVLMVASWFTSDPIATVNAAFLLSFPLIAMMSYAVLRRLSTGILFSAIASVLFALLPWRLERVEHLALSAYLSIPVGVLWLAMLFVIADKERRSKFTWIAVFSLSAFLGLGQPYWLFFFMMLGVFTALLAAPRVRSIADFIALATAFLGGLIAFAAWALVPRWFQPEIPLARVADRLLSDQLSYGGHIVSLFEPIGHWSSTWEILAPLRMWRSTLSGWEGTAFVSSGLVAFIIVALLMSLTLPLSIQRLVRQRSFALGDSLEIHTYWISVFVLSLLLFTTGGLGLLFGSLVSTQIRAYGRLAPVVVFLSIVVVSSGWSFHRRAYPQLGRSGFAAGSFLAFFAAALVLDSVLWTPALDRDTEIRADMAAYAHEVDTALGPACPIFTYPIHAFPEGGGMNGQNPHSDFVPFIFWGDHPMSFGAVKTQLGQQWDDDLNTDVSKVPAVAKALGFCAIQVDRLKLQSPDDVASEFAARGARSIAEVRSRWQAFDLADVAADPAASEALKLRLESSVVSGLENETSDDLGVYRRVVPGRAAVLSIGNPSPDARIAEASLVLNEAECDIPGPVKFDATSSAGAARVTGPTTTLIGSSAKRLDWRVSVAPNEIVNLTLHAPSLCLDGAEAPLRDLRLRDFEVNEVTN